ncbi:MAG: glucosamine-6-phosphate deaminase [Thermoguttaceae bacterium]|nr:glucosamine-6-phosphate deaminase [Thermoguttaceae bacterium]
MLVKSGKTDLLSWRAYSDRESMGLAAASYAEGLIRALLAQKDELRMIFAAAPSQNEVLKNLAQSPNIPWERIHAFHMDEYVGLDPAAPQGFGNFLRDRLFGLVPFKSVHYLQEAEAYSELLREGEVDICCLGIGENGHIAFNDPPVADFNDPQTVKVVELDSVCRQQQVNDGCFASLDEVPTHAMTLTIPTLFACSHLVCTVPAATKREAVRRLLTDAEISTEVPATIMRRHPSVSLFLDSDSLPEFS